MLALTRAELLDRLKAPPVTQLDGLVQVYGDCPADMRREYQLPIASYVSDICRRLYAADNKRPQKFTDPGIVVRIGDVRTNIAEVVSRPAKRTDGSCLASAIASRNGHDVYFPQNGKAYAAGYR